jgi:hypothetical protein
MPTILSALAAPSWPLRPEREAPTRSRRRPARSIHNIKKAYALIAALIALVLAAVAVPASAATTTSTVVIHGVTFTDFYPEGLCGSEGPNYVTFTFDTEVTHTTEHADGSFSFQDASTGTYHADYVDPAIPDQDSRQVGSFHLTLTPGGTTVVSLAFHDFPTGVRIWQRYHLTVVDGNPVVERFIEKIEPGCP